MSDTLVLEEAGQQIRDVIIPSTRVDGWNAAKQRRFLEAVAEGETVTDACGKVRLSPQSAYAFRRRPKGRAFDLGWKAADLLARERVAANLMLRSLEGQEVEFTRADGSVSTRHHYDNRLAVQMLNRLDRYADASERTAPGHAARMIAADFDAYLDLVGDDGGPARAGLFMLARNTDGEAAAAELEPVLALARADRMIRCGSAAADVGLADLDAARRADWTAEQWAHAEAAGLVVLAPPPTPTPERATEAPASTCQPVSTSPVPVADDEPVWRCDLSGEWRTSFPPPADFIGEEDGAYGWRDYSRELDPDELALVEGAQIGITGERRIEQARARDRWFAALAAAADGKKDVAGNGGTDEADDGTRHQDADREDEDRGDDGDWDDDDDWDDDWDDEEGDAQDAGNEDGGNEDHDDLSEHRPDCASGAGHAAPIAADAIRAEPATPRSAEWMPPPSPDAEAL
ncbi:MAG TPA: hypothetical protein VF592_05410 [Sphingomonas sp.]|jgi:hypothetical protein|uniref:hypothetical protein n=1 Tax=Sphingomonas sp. TaxID=28214 RepID=UPI002EDB82D0